MSHPLKRFLPLVVVASFMAVFAPAALAGGKATERLDDFHSGLLERYPDVAHISPDELEAMPQDDLLIFDVRESDEYEVSRIEGAIRVPPSIRPSTFLEEYARDLKGKTVVLYCSVGERSSRLAERVMSYSTDAEAIYNLEGGIFKWHNEYRDVANAGGDTTFVHPFSRRWGRLLERQDQTRMTLE